MGKSLGKHHTDENEWDSEESFKDKKRKKKEVELRRSRKRNYNDEYEYENVNRRAYRTK